MGLSHIVERIEWLLDNATECWSINDENNCLTYISDDDYIAIIKSKNEKVIYIIVSEEKLTIPKIFFNEIYETLVSYFTNYEEVLDNNVINLMEILHGDAI